MKHRDFHAGQSALGLMTRNTEAMFAPRMAQWEAFGKGLQDANAIVQNRHAFNEQLEQNRIQNEFKNKEFGFREKELQENQRQFDQRHALDKQNSATDRAYKGALTALHYFNIDKARKDEENAQNGWLIAEELKKKWALDPNSLTLQQLDFLEKHNFKISDPNNKLAVRTMAFHEKYNANEKALRNIEKVLQGGDLRGIWYGVKRIADDWSSGLTGISKEENEHLVALNNVIDAIIKNQYGNATSAQKEQQRRKLFDQYFASPEQFKARLMTQAQDIMSQQKIDMEILQEFGISKDASTKYNQQLENNKKAFEAFAASKTKEIQRYIPPVKLMKD